MLGSLVGALIVGVFRNGLTLMGVSSVYQVLITGILVILAVATRPALAQGSAADESPARRDEHAASCARPRAGEAVRPRGRARRRGLRGARRRDHGGDRRQRRRKVIADQGTVAARSSPTQARSGSTVADALAHADGRAPRRHRDGVSGSGGRARADASPRTSSSAASCDGPAAWAACCGMLDQTRMRAEARATSRGLGIRVRSMTQPLETLSGGQRQGVAVARARGIRAARRHHGRTDGGARRARERRWCST